MLLTYICCIYEPKSLNSHSNLHNTILETRTEFGGEDDKYNDLSLQ